MPYVDGIREDTQPDTVLQIKKIIAKTCGKQHAIQHQNREPDGLE